MKDSIPLKGFVFKLRRYYPPMTYKKALAWIELGMLPVWQRIGKERLWVRISRMGEFLESLGFDKSTIEAVIQDLSS